MISFTVMLILCIIIFLIATIWLIIICIETKRNKEKIGEKIITGLFSALSFISILSMPVPTPTIYLSYNKESDNNEIEITIDSNDSSPLIHTYYSLDGNPINNGIEYEGMFTVSNPTIVYARNRFLWWWSGTDDKPCAFENLNFVNESKNSDYIDTHEDMESQEIWESETSIESEEESTTSSQNNLEDNSTYQEFMSESAADETVSSPQVTETTNISEGLNPSEGYNLMKYVNQERQKVGVDDLVWNSDLALKAQNIVTQYVEFGDILILDDSFYVIGRQCNGARNAETAVSHWITGNNWIPSQAENLLNSNYTQIGGALYYLPDGNEYGYHYFWIICLQ